MLPAIRFAPAPELTGGRYSRLSIIFYYDTLPLDGGLASEW